MPASGSAIGGCASRVERHDPAKGGLSASFLASEAKKGHILLFLPNEQQGVQHEGEPMNGLITNWLMASGVIAVVVSVVASAEPATRPAETPPVGKKVIEFGWDEPDTAFMRKHAAQMDASPFDGCVYHLRYIKPDGKDADFIWSCWGRQAFTVEQIQHAIDDLKATHFKHLRHNFLRFNVTPGDLDWFDDYSAVINNARLAATAARAAASASCSTPSSTKKPSLTTVSNLAPRREPGRSMQPRPANAAARSCRRFRTGSRDSRC